MIDRYAPASTDRPAVAPPAFGDTDAHHSITVPLNLDRDERLASERSPA
jgi:hypothetical protein